VVSQGGVVSCAVTVSVIAKIGREVPLSTVAEQTSFTAALAQESESNAHAQDSLSLQETQPLQSVASEPGVDEGGIYERNIIVAETPAVTVDGKAVEEPSGDREISAAGDKLTASSEECTEVSRDAAETLTSAEILTETSTAAGVKTIISKETVTKKKKKSKERQDKTSSEIVEVIQNVEEAEEEISAEGKLQRAVAEEIVVEESKVDDRTVTDAITAVEDSVVDDTAAADVEVIEVEYSEEEYAGPLPVIEVQPVATSVNAGETARLVCRVAEEPAARVHWSKNGQRLDVSSENGKINVGVDAETSTHFLEIAEASPDDVGEYTLTAESEGGIVSCTVSVDVVSESDVSPTPKQISRQNNLSEEVTADDKQRNEETADVVVDESKVDAKATTAADDAAAKNVAAAEAVDAVRELSVSSQPLAVAEDLERLTPLQRTAVDSEVTTESSTESLGKVETGEAVVTEIPEQLQPRAREVAPAFVSVPQPVVVDEGSAVRLRCQVEGQI